MKSPISSKTLWLNVVLFLLAIVNIVDTNLVEAIGLDYATVNTILIFVGTVLNFVLRYFLTGEPVSENAKEKAFLAEIARRKY